FCARRCAAAGAREMTGRVSLVGAGPGDPELLTLKAVKRLEEADLVLYDALLDPATLRVPPPHSIGFCLHSCFTMSTQMRSSFLCGRPFVSSSEEAHYTSLISTKGN